jgi:Amt family ammonium transporter
MACLSLLQVGKVPCQLGAVDYAGGGPVHIASGVSALAFAWVVGPRAAWNQVLKPHNMSNVFVGTGLLIFGWIGFNGGSGGIASSRACMAGISFILNPSFCIHHFVIIREVISVFIYISLVWVLLEFFSTGKISGIANCLGALAGLVAITPGSGYVDPWAGIIIGGLTSFICYFAMFQKKLTGIDDSLDVFAVHGVGGNAFLIL